ncbi:MAG: response regulator transcription factor [Alistipes sp.]|nr:response regulator transcription factor [Alistipes sp.]
MNRGTILIYSQQRLLATLLAATIRDDNRHIIYCSSLQQLIAKSNSLRPTLIYIIDSAPFMNGANLMEMLRRSSLHRPTIYVITWQQSEHTVLSLLECGVDQYFTFPISMLRLRLKTLAHDSQ